MKLTERALKKIVKHTGLGHNPLHIREKIKRANVDEKTRHALVKQYDRLIHGRTMTTQEAKKLLFALRDKKVVDLRRETYLDSIAYDPIRVLESVQHEIKAEDHEVMREQRIAEEQQLKDLDRQKKEKKKQEEQAALESSVSAGSSTHTVGAHPPKGKTPAAAHYTGKAA